ncbi:MAG: hypothetical protein ACI9JM_000444 [Halioglobus sp.]|jgi:hypothetical protein
MFKKTVLMATIALAISATAQADYQFEADGAYYRSRIDIGKDDGDVGRLAIGGSFFLNSVDTSKGPLSEAAFLDHASRMSAYYFYTELDDTVEDLDGDEFGIDGRYVLDLDSVPLIFGGAWSLQTPEISDIDFYRLGFGVYVTDTATVLVSYRTSDAEEDGAANIDAGDVDAYELAIEHL